MTWIWDIKSREEEEKKETFRLKSQRSKEEDKGFLSLTVINENIYDIMV